jgi:hypothetical protein
LIDRSSVRHELITDILASSVLPHHGIAQRDTALIDWDDGRSLSRNRHSLDAISRNTGESDRRSRKLDNSRKPQLRVLLHYTVWKIQRRIAALLTMDLASSVRP